MVSAPPLARLYAALRRRPPALTLPVLAAIAGLLAAVSVAAGASFDVPWPILGAMVASSASVPAALAATTPREYWQSEHGLLDLSFGQILLVLGCAVAPGVLVVALLPETRNLLPATVFPGVGLAVLGQAVGGKYGGNRTYHVPADGALVDHWNRASVALEQGVDEFNANESYAAYHWLEDARRRYERIADEVERPVKGEAADRYAAAAAELRDACFEDSQNGRVAAIDVYESELDAVSEVLAYRVCDECGERHPVDECVKIQDEETVYCEACYHEISNEAAGEPNVEDYDAAERTTDESPADRADRSTGKDDGEAEADGGTGEGRQGGDSASTHSETAESADSRDVDEAEDDDEEADEANDGREKSNDDVTGGSRRAETEDDTTASGSECMSVDEARKVLGIEGRLTPGKIEEAYRVQTKENHPDVGGSEEEMRRINKARERLKAVLD